MAKYLLAVLCVAAMAIFALPVRAADDVVSAVHGTVTKVDSGTKTMVVKTKDGSEHTIHYADKTVVHGADATATGAKDSYKGVKEGSEVVVHYTEKGTEKTGVEIDRVGKDGVKTADGTEKTFRVAGHDTAVSAEEIGKGTEKGAKVTVYYTESAGKGVAHFFEKL
jgi:hypothetical protein